MAREDAPPDLRPSTAGVMLGRPRTRRQVLRLAALGAGSGMFSWLLAACESGIAGQPSIVDRLPTGTPGVAVPTIAPTAAPAATRPPELARPVTPTERPRPLATATRAATSTPVGVVRPIAPGSGVAPRQPIQDGSRIPWQGQQWYLHGANVPWLNWGRDFGGGTKDGVSKPDNRKSLSDGFAAAKATGVNVIRWWVFEGDAWQVKRDDAGMPTGLAEAIYADFDAALDLAEQHDLYYVFVLFSAPQHIPRSWMEDADQRAKLGNVLGPLFARYKDNPRVMTWEVFNEPEFDVWDLRVKEEPIKATIKEIASAVHANSNAYVTVGSAMLDGLAMMKGLGLDYYQAHWYDYMTTGKWCALCTTYEEVRRRFDLDAPLVIGEIYLSPELENPHLRLDDFYTKGYAGVWPWSIFPDVTQDKYAIDWNAMRTFAGKHPDLGPRTTEALPPTDAAPTLRLSLRSTAQVGARRAVTGQRQPIDVKVTATVAARALVEMEVYAPSGQQVFQQAFEDQSFRPGETKVYSTVWTVPLDAAPGTYVVKVGVFAPDRGTRYDSNESAATFTVVR